MKQYIDKSALVEEIERRKKYYENIQMIKPVYESNIEDFNELLSFLDTLEVKEVDIRSEVSNWWNSHYAGVKQGYTFEGYSGHYMDNSTIVNLAQYFYELGIKSQTKDMIEALHTEYEKGRADVIADTLSWLENCWPRYCSNQTIIEGFKEAIKD